MDAIREYRSRDAGNSGIAVQRLEHFRDPFAVHQEIIVQQYYDIEATRHVLQRMITLHGQTRLAFDHEQSGSACERARILVRYTGDDDQIRPHGLRIDEGDDTFKHFGAPACGEDQADLCIPGGRWQAHFPGQGYLRTDSRIQHSPRRPMHAFLETGKDSPSCAGLNRSDRANGANHSSQHLDDHAIGAADAALLPTPRKRTYPERRSVHCMRCGSWLPAPVPIEQSNNRGAHP